MLESLEIRDYAIIDRAEISFGKGMTVLSGETGAGKSILIGALGLILGERSDSDAVRHGADKTQTTAGFDLRDCQAAKNWLAEHDLLDEDDEHQCLIRRTISSDGRSKAFINGQKVSVRDLRELGELLVDIHGQHANQTLLKPDMQRQIVDAFIDQPDLLSEIAELSRRWKQVSLDIETLSKNEDTEQRLDYLQFQLSELEALNLGDSELEELNTEHKRLANAGQILDNGQRALSALFESDESSAYQALTEAKNSLADLGKLDAGFEETAKICDEAVILVQEAADTLRRKLDNLELDPARLDEVEQRLSQIHDLARKHRVTPSELSSLTQQLRDEADALADAGNRIKQLEQERETILAAYTDQAQALSKARIKAAKGLSDRVSQHISGLGMPDGRLDISIQTDESLTPRPQGRDRIEFLICANPGQTPRPLSKVASGGELSRISLAIQVENIRASEVPTLIFDEVDAGIGGGVAEIVGRLLQQLGEQGQSLCVTHLPQVAAQASHHLRISKALDGEVMRTRIQPLSDQARIEEVARMLGGVKITDQTRAHAEEMLGIN